MLGIMLRKILLILATVGILCAQPKGGKPKPLRK